MSLFRKKTIVAESAYLAQERRKFEKERESFEAEKKEFEQLQAKQLTDYSHTAALLDAKEKQLEGNERACQSQLELIGDFIHEQKRINERIQKAIDFTQEIVGRHNNSLDKHTSDLVLHNWITIEALSEISNQRMELFEFCLAPEIFKGSGLEYIPPFKSIEKIYKSINSGFDKEARTFKMIGNSYGRFKAKRILPIAFFILLDNAWKYTLPDKSIDITFTEDRNKKQLIIEISNWGPWIEDEELPQLTLRSFRAKAAQSAVQNGKGLGLSIAKSIFEICNVDFEYRKIDCKPLIIAGVKYGKFCVRMKFNPIEI